MIVLFLGVILVDLPASEGAALTSISVTSAYPTLTAPVQTHFEETDPALNYSSTWSSYACTPCSGGAVKSSNQTGARVTFAFTGTGIKWTAGKGPMAGKARVYLDGVNKGLVDLYAPDLKAYQLIQTTGLSPGNHTLIIGVTGQKNPYSTGYFIDVDSFDVVPDSALNEPPIVGTLTIQPGTPHAEDYLTANLSSVSDPDGDVLTFIYTWNKNGTVITGQTTEILAAGQFVKGDIISVDIAVSDGSHTVTVESPFVTILDTPPIVSASPPAITLDGQPLNFTVIASDVDNDPITFAILYGPDGMQIDSSGQVSWTPSGPMFDDWMDVHYDIRATAAGASVDYTGTITVTDPVRQRPLVRTGIQIPHRSDGIRITDFNGDGKAEILVTDNNMLLYTLVFDGANYVQDWVYPFKLAPGGSITAVEAHDINGDGNPDMVIGAGSRIVIIDGVSRKLIGEISDGYSVHYSIHVADIDNDGELEVVYLGSSDPYSNQETINVYSISNLQLKWKSPILDYGISLSVGNVDSDPALEIVTAKGYVFDGVSHANQWAYGPGFGSMVDTGDLDHDGIDEIIGATRWGPIQVFSAVFKSPLWEILGSSGGTDVILVANIDSNPQAEILVGDAQWGNVTAYDGSTGVGIKEWGITFQAYGVSSIATGDTDGDGALEFVWTSGAGDSGPDSLVVAGLNPAIQVEWTNGTEFDGLSGKALLQLDGPFVGGRWLTTAVGQKQALFASVSTNSSYAGTRLLGLDPVTGRLTWSSEVGSNWGRRASLDGTDYDGDGIDEVFLTTAKLYDGYFTAYDFNRNLVEWTSASGIGQGQAVTHGDLNGDGHEDLIAVTSDGYIYAYNVWNQTLIWKSTKLPGYGTTDIEVADLDGDGTLEIIAASADTLSIYEKSALFGYILRHLETVTGIYTLGVADVDQDGIPDILTATGDQFFNSTSTVRVYDGVTFSQKAGYTLSGNITDLTVTPAGNGHRNLTIAFSQQIYGGYFYETLDYIAMVDPLTGAEIWRSPELIGQVQRNSMSFADTNNDGDLELILGTSEAMYVTQ
jgi:hypothetical protein